MVRCGRGTPTVFPSRFSVKPNKLICWPRGLCSKPADVRGFVAYVPVLCPVVQRDVSPRSQIHDVELNRKELGLPPRNWSGNTVAINHEPSWIQRLCNVVELWAKERQSARVGARARVRARECKGARERKRTVSDQSYNAIDQSLNISAALLVINQLVNAAQTHRPKL